MAKSYLSMRFAVDGEPQFSRAFDVMGGKFMDLRPVFEQISTDFFFHMQTVFDMEGAVDEKARWAPLSISYRLWKERHFPGAKILHLTGRMEASLTERGHPDSLLSVTKTDMQIGTQVPYAIKHQRGTGNLLKRKVIDMTERQKKRWTHLVHGWIYRIAREQWGRLKPPYR